MLDLDMEKMDMKELYELKENIEDFITRKKEGFVQTFPLKPFSLLPWMNELKEIGLDYVVVDISGSNRGKRDILELKERLINSGKYSKLSTFNYFGKLE